MQVKSGDRVLLNAQVKAEPAEDVVTRDYYAQLPQIRVTGAASANPMQPDSVVAIILDGNDVARLIECALRHPQPNMRYGVLAAIWNHPDRSGRSSRSGSTRQMRSPISAKSSRRRSPKPDARHRPTLLTPRARAPNRCCRECRRRLISETAADADPSRRAAR